jgi:hypothetical protein
MRPIKCCQIVSSFQEPFSFTLIKSSEKATISPGFNEERIASAQLSPRFPFVIFLSSHNFPWNALCSTDGISADNSSPLMDCNAGSALTFGSCIYYPQSKRSSSSQGTRFRIAAAFRRMLSNCSLSDFAISTNPFSIPAA